MVDPHGRVLLVEDEATPGTQIAEHLRGAGLEVRWVRSVRDARVELRERPPDVLVLDLTLETDGLELLQALRFSPDEPRGGIVVLAEDSDDGGRERALQLGAAAVVDKPLRGGAVVEAVCELFDEL